VTHDHIATAADGTSIAWSRQGAGTPVVLVHGITESAATFDPVVERLLPHDPGFEVITLDLRGHGESGAASTHDLAAMAGDVIAVIEAAGLVDHQTARRVHLVGHSLGGAVVSAAAAALPVASVVDIDQSLQLSAFKEQLVAVEVALRDPDQFGFVIEAMFEAMGGPLLGDAERARVASIRRPEHDVVLGVWDLLLTAPEADIAAAVDAALAGYRDHPTPYLALFGIDPGAGYAEWLAERVPGASVETWPDHGHYPHLVDPDRFVDRLLAFWVGSTGG
jgi:pimeloyl-ACP methyl ester carboxylesterase